MSGIINFKRLLLCCIMAIGLTYVSLLVPGTVIAVCSHIDYPEYCPVKAYGFPLLFLADSQSISPVGSVCRNPIWVLIGEDDLLPRELAMSFAFWLWIVFAAEGFWQRCWRLWDGYKRHHMSDQ